MLIVAEKYQTGFDEPLLHTMFVDKKLSGVKAVQTLSRLNRTMRGKEDTFVLDFANEREEIQKAFQPYYEATVLEEETDPNLIYSLKRQLDDFHVYQEHEIELFAKKFYQKTIPTLDTLSPILTPALERYEILEDKKKDEFKSLLHAFNRTYWQEVYLVWESGSITAREAMKRLNLKPTSFYKLAKNYKG